MQTNKQLVKFMDTTCSVCQLLLLLDQIAEVNGFFLTESPVDESELNFTPEYSGVLFGTYQKKQFNIGCLIQPNNNGNTLILRVVGNPDIYDVTDGCDFNTGKKILNYMQQELVAQINFYTIDDMDF